MPAKAFIAYSRDDSSFVLQLARDLRSAGADIWIDQLDIRAGDLWDRAVEKALHDCERVLVILSPNSVSSENVMDEVYYAIEHGKQAIPVLYRDCRVPLRIRRLHFVDFRGEYDAGLEDLLRALDAGSRRSTEAEKPESAAPAGTPRPARHLVKRAFLLFPPSGALAWLLHLLFYGGFGLMATSLLGVGLAIAGIWAPVLAMLAWLANLVDTAAGTPNRRSGAQRAFLLYWPGNLGARILHLAFYAGAPFLAFGALGVVLLYNEEPSPDGFVGLAVFAGMLSLLRSVARNIDRSGEAEAPALRPVRSAKRSA